MSVDCDCAAAHQLATVEAALLNGFSSVGSLTAQWALSALTPAFKAVKPLIRVITGVLLVLLWQNYTHL